jgi:hypothetical protein
MISASAPSPGSPLHAYLGRDYGSYSCSVTGELWIVGGALAVAFGGLGPWPLGVNRIFFDLKNMAGGALFLYSAFVLALFTGMRSGLSLILMN